MRAWHISNRVHLSVHVALTTPVISPPKFAAMPVQNLASLRVDFDFENPCYVLQLASHGDPSEAAGTHMVAAALSNNSIKVYKQALADFQHVCNLQGHTGTISDVCMPLARSPDTVVSSSVDGTVRCWDARQGSCTQRCAPDPADPLKPPAALL